MKILYSLPHPADRLGMQGAGHLVRATALINALQNRGHQLTRMEAAAGAAAGTPVNTYRRVVKRVMPRRFAMILRDWGRIQFGKAYGGRLAQAAREMQPDLILETHIAFSLGGKIASERTGIPLVLDDCAPAWEEEREYGVGLGHQANSIHREVTGHAKLLVAVNKSMHRLLLEEGAASEKVITIENGIDPGYFRPQPGNSARREQYHIPQDAMVVVFVGSFQRFHRVDLLLQAFQQVLSFERAHLLLVGAGQTYEECRALAAGLGLTGRVTFTGGVPHEEVASYIAAGDMAIVPAHSDYANPMKLYEYMALGKAVLAPRQSTITEIVTDGLDALLFEPGNAAAMADGMLRLLRDPVLRERLGAAAKKLALSQTWDHRAATLEAALLKIITIDHEPDQCPPPSSS
ncbi:MAG TPA: glycosyltransferase family 4 protein [Anaerolineales bacterium]